MRLTAKQTRKLFTDVPYWIDGAGDSHRIITPELENKLDSGRCTHCGKVLNWGICRNTRCVIFGRHDFFKRIGLCNPKAVVSAT